MWSFKGMVRQGWFQLFVALNNSHNLFFFLLHFYAVFSVKRYAAKPTPNFHSLFSLLLLSPSFHSLLSLFLFLSEFLSVFLSVRLFWKRCQHCCFYTKRLLLSDGWRQPQLQRRACVCLAAEGRSHWKGQNWEALLVTAMKTLTSTNRIAISNNCAQFFLYTYIYIYIYMYKNKSKSKYYKVERWG